MPRHILPLADPKCYTEYRIETSGENFEKLWECLQQTDGQELFLGAQQGFSLWRDGGGISISTKLNGIPPKSQYQIKKSKQAQKFISAFFE